MMIKRLFRFISLITAIVPFFAGCGSEPESGKIQAVTLAPPDGFLESRPSSRMPKGAAVEAVNGSVKLTLEVMETTIPKGLSSIWTKVTLTNVGSEPIPVLDEIFFEKAEALLDPSRSATLLEIIGPNGERPFRMEPEAHPPSEECLAKHPLVGLEEPDRFLSLEPGKSTSTPAAAYQSFSEGWCEGKDRPSPTGDYFELRGLFFQPGVYRIRAVYDHRQVSEAQKKFGEAPSGSGVRVETPWIPIEVPA